MRTFSGGWFAAVATFYVILATHNQGILQQIIFLGLGATAAGIAAVQLRRP